MTPLDHGGWSLSLHFHLLAAKTLPTGPCDDVIAQKQKSVVPLQTFRHDLERVFISTVYVTPDVCAECFDSFRSISDICKPTWGGVHVSAGYVRARRAAATRQTGFQPGFYGLKTVP